MSVQALHRPCLVELQRALRLAFNTDFLILPTTRISQGLQPKRRVSFSLPWISSIGSALTVPCTPVTPLACLGHSSRADRADHWILALLRRPSW